MQKLSELRKLKGMELLFLLVVVSVSFCPGLLAIWLYAPELIEKCSAAVLFLLSSAMSIPLVLFKVGSLTDPEMSSNQVFSRIGAASGLTLFVLGAPLFYCFVYKKSPVYFAVFAFAMEVTMLAAIQIEHRNRIKKRRAQPASPQEAD
jgi:predicted Abi (CAAX) family protease